MGGRGRGQDRGRGGGGGGRAGGSSTPGRESPVLNSAAYNRGGDRGSFRGGYRGGDPGGFRGGSGRSRPNYRGSFGAGHGRGGVFAPDVPGIVDARLTDGFQDALVVSMRSARRYNNSDLPSRPGFGTAGTAIKLRTNFFPISVPRIPIYEYGVAFDPPAKLSERVKILNLAGQTDEWRQAQLTGRVAYGRSAKLYASFIFQSPLIITIQYTGDDGRNPKQYTLTISFIKPIDTQGLVGYLEGRPEQRNFNFMPVLQAMNIILSAYPSHVADVGVKVGRKYYPGPSPTFPPVPLGGGLQAQHGFYVSVRTAWRQLMVNVNVCTAAFYTPGNLAERMMEFMTTSPNSRLVSFVRGIRVKIPRLSDRTKMAWTVAHSNARQQRVRSADGSDEATVEQFYQSKHNILLKHPELPLIRCGPSQTCLPAELCTIVKEQPFRGRVPDELASNMLTVVRQYPNMIGDAIVHRGLLQLDLAPTSPPASSFGITVGDQMAVVPGRILPLPTVRYHGGNPPAIDDRRASWNLRGVRFAIGGTGPNDPELDRTWRGFADMCIRSGMKADPARPQITVAKLPQKTPQDPLRSGAIQTIREALLKLYPKPRIVLVVLSNGDRHVYSGLKHLCDVVLDVATVCVHAAKIRKEKGQVQYFANVVLKFNMKLGGVNHELAEKNMAWLNKEPTMLVGMDMAHPGDGSAMGTPSVAAVVASVDKRMSQFPASLRIQKWSSTEIISDLESMFVERLQAYRNCNNGTLPSRVLVYRNGLPEGQFATVVNGELPQIRAAFYRVSRGKRYNPQLTIVFCGKRRNTRFFPTDPAHATHCGNPKPGTVVDCGTTAVYEYDFYLQAHGETVQGSTRPTHYYVVHDEIAMSADQLQGLTNDMSYMSARATKAVSLVSPAYYADLASKRGRCYLQDIPESGDPNKVMQAARMLFRYDSNPDGVGGSLKDTMFYL
ncbi:Piwi domain-containing protein [Daedaleopsis nitida]|nr:Piwi domain-containing protein [Daedaleopsis nitida]